MTQIKDMNDLVNHSKYLERFKRLAEVAPDSMSVEGDLLIVEALPKVGKHVDLGGVTIEIRDDKMSRSGHNDKLMEFGIVLATGPGDVYEDGTRAEMNIKVGDIILLPGNTTYYSAFGSLKDYKEYSIGVTRAASVLINFKDPVKVFEVLNA